MKWSGFWMLATLAVLCLLEGHTTLAAPSPRTDDLLKTLQDLEQIYSSMARPRFGKRDRVINSNGLYHNGGGADYADIQSNDDGMNVPVAKWRVGGMVPDSTIEMRTVRDRISTRDDVRSMGQQQLHHLYQTRLN